MTRRRERSRGPVRGRTPIRSEDRPEEVRISGLHACRAVFEKRPDDVLRVWVTEERVSDVGPILKACASTRRPYHVTDPAEVEAVSGTSHHEGICILARARTARLEDLLEEPEPRAPVVVLDGVRNPHNVGAILRTAAHFGVRAVIVPSGRWLTPAGRRVAEGGAEYVDVVEASPLSDVVRRLRARGYQVVATSGRADVTLEQAELRMPCAILLGAEHEGLDPALRRLSDVHVRIAGTGHVESLNVSAAAAVVLARCWMLRMHQHTADKVRSK